MYYFSARKIYFVTEYFSQFVESKGNKCIIKKCNYKSMPQQEYQ